MELSVVAPFYNESDAVKAFFNRIIPVLRKSGCSFEIVCVNDGSQDNTLDKLLSEKKKHKEIKIINFSRNFGKDAAMTAGIDFAEGDCVIPIDCDLQDPPELIIDMVKKWRNGFDIILARRTDRSSDSFVKRITAKAFYNLYNKIAYCPLPNNVGDFRLMNRKVVEIIKSFPERTRFMKGLFSFVGFKTAYVDYERPVREKGTTKWSYWKLFNYAIDGITSFSTFPLKICTYVGLIVTVFAFARGVWIMLRVFLHGVDVPGYASLMATMLLLGGTQMIFLGIIGEYISRIYTETKQRPIYIVKDIIK